MDRPALIIAEGLLYYLAEDEVKTLLNRLVDHFPKGQIIFDAVSKLYLRLQKTNVGISATGARMRWGLGSVNELEQWMHQVKLITKLSAMDPDLPNIKKMPGSMRLTVRVLSHIPILREMGLMLRYQF